MSGSHPGPVYTGLFRGKHQPQRERPGSSGFLTPTPTGGLHLCPRPMAFLSLLVPLCTMRAKVGEYSEVPKGVCTCACVCVYALSCVRLFVTPWTVALQAPLSMGFPRKEYWSGLPFPSLVPKVEDKTKERGGQRKLSPSSWSVPCPES